jgi:outer membrane protein assembly factor BamA
MDRQLSLIVTLVGMALAGWPARAQTAPEKPRDCAPGEISAAGKECAPPPAVQPTVRQIHVVTQNIFDPQKPGEDRALFRLANRFHIVTRPNVIERQVLLKPGAAYSPEEAAESERILRKNRYLYDAQIHPVPVGDGQVDVNVITRDVWTLQGGVGFRRSGGANTVHFDVQDVNFLGAGKGISLSHQSTVDRTTNLVSYDDPNLLGTHGRLDVAYGDNSDGSLRQLALERPFYSLDTRWALGVQASLDDRVDPLYDLGHVFDRFQHRQDVFGVYAGLSPGLENHGTHRWLTGFSVERDRFSPAAGFDPPTLLPPDRTLAYPWVSYEYLQDGYFTERDLNRIQRTEDVNVGRQLHLRLGYSSTAWGGTLNRFLTDTSASIGWRPGPRQLLLTSVQGGARFGGGGAENLLVGGSVRYYARDFGDNLFVAGIEGDVAHKLDPEHQLLLGGDTGLRGYPLRYLQGDHRVLLTVEQRFYSNRELFHLLHYGAAVFFDAGSAWFEDGDGKVAADRKLRKDIGLGLRIGSSRSARGSMIHLDLAFPLDGDPSIKRIQWLVSTSDTF